MDDVSETALRITENNRQWCSQAADRGRLNREGKRQLGCCFDGKLWPAYQSLSLTATTIMLHNLSADISRRNIQSRLATIKVYAYWNRLESMKRSSFRLSVCLSHRSTAAAACGEFAAERPADGRYRSTSAGASAHSSCRRAQQQRRRCTALSNKRGQCLVDSRGTRLNTDLFTSKQTVSLRILRRYAYALGSPTVRKSILVMRRVHGDLSLLARPSGIPTPAAVHLPDCTFQNTIISACRLRFCSLPAFHYIVFSSKASVGDCPARQTGRQPDRA